MGLCYSLRSRLAAAHPSAPYGGPADAGPPPAAAAGEHGDPQVRHRLRQDLVAKERADKKRSKSIDKTLKAEKREYKQTHRLLLLGEARRERSGAGRRGGARQVRGGPGRTGTRPHPLPRGCGPGRRRGVAQGGGSRTPAGGTPRPPAGAGAAAGDGGRSGGEPPARGTPSVRCVPSFCAVPSVVVVVVVPQRAAGGPSPAGRGMLLRRHRGPPGGSPVERLCLSVCLSGRCGVSVRPVGSVRGVRSVRGATRHRDPPGVCGGVPTPARRGGARSVRHEWAAGRGASASGGDRVRRVRGVRSRLRQPSGGPRVSVAGDSGGELQGAPENNIGRDFLGLRGKSSYSRGTAPSGVVGAARVQRSVGRTPAARRGRAAPAHGWVCAGTGGHRGSERGGCPVGHGLCGGIGAVWAVRLL